jgi:hypothetical protein
MAQLQIETTSFPNGNQARIVHVPLHTPAPQIIAALELAPPRALLILNGGTAKLLPELQEQLSEVFTSGLARAVAETQITVITGGTDAGIFSLLGQGMAAAGRSAACIGVTVKEPVTWPGKTDGEAPLEPNHSHFVLVEGGDWGAETATMYDLAAALSHDCPSVAVFASGGEITIHELQANIRQNRPMILLAGSGRNTDAVLAARTGLVIRDPRVTEIARADNIIPFNISEGPEALHALICRLCSGQSQNGSRP